uniref:Testis-expressed protein 30 n=1 Tax=Phallusia mammillata TaxID=59560 RepID=A0A6F9DUQ5_9ASCI|nr:testis-expressed protein 30 [Phallusia mammillata]
MNVEIQIPFNEKTLAASVEVPTQWTNGPKTCVILTHGAGGDKDFYQLKILSNKLMDSGVMCVRFTCKGLNIKYRTKVYVEVVRYVFEEYTYLDGFILGGRSMGSRSAVAAATCILSSQNNTKLSPKPSKDKKLVSRKRKLTCVECGAVHPNNNCKVIGVLCLAFPLSPKGKPDRTDSLLQSPGIPHLFVSGTEDEMCDLKLLLETIEKMNKADLKEMPKLSIDSAYLSFADPLFPHTLLQINNAKHSFKIKGISEQEVMEHINEVVSKWIPVCQSMLQ